MPSPRQTHPLDEPSIAQSRKAGPLPGWRLRRLLPTGLALVLAASLAANAYLVRASNGYYRAAQAVRLDPAGLKAYAAERAGQAARGKPALVVFGDSRALMWSEPTAATEYRIVNRGIANQTTAQILLRTDEDVAPLHPSVVVLEAGVNDLKNIAEFPERRGEIVADCEANLKRIVELCRQTGATVVLVSIFRIGDLTLWRRPFWSNDVDAAVGDVNDFLRGLAGDGIVLFNADPVLDDARGKVRPEYQMDFLHLVPSGYAALNERLIPLVRALPR